MPISRLVNQPMVLIVKDKQKYPNVAALIAAAKAEPGKITFASSGDGSPQHLGGLLAPAKTPRAIIDQLNHLVQTAFDAEQKAKLADSGIEVATSTPEELQRIITREIKIHAELVKAAGLTPQ